jgi:hypothetical protein
MIEDGKSGHRERLRERFLDKDAEEFSDEMVLELLLTFAIARKDVRPLAHELIQVFGSINEVLAASTEDLSVVKGLGQSSVTLLKLVNFIKSITERTEKQGSRSKSAGSAQQKLFQDLTADQSTKHQTADSPGTTIDEPGEPAISETQPETESEISSSASAASEVKDPQAQTPLSNKTPSNNTITRRKFQVSNGYLLEFDQLARVLHCLIEHWGTVKIKRTVLQEGTGLADRHVESLVSIGSAMGLIKPGAQVLTPTGLLIAKHDIFFEKKASLEWCHYVGASSYRNLIWFEIFNHILREPVAMTQDDWSKKMRSDLAETYSTRTVNKGLCEELRFVIDAYMKRNFSKLEILHQSSDQSFYQPRYTVFVPLVLAAMIYDFCAKNETNLFQVGEMAATPGSPAVVFGLDAQSFRQQVEVLHNRGWLRYETTHNLDQIRIKPGFSVIEFLTAHYEDREPCVRADEFLEAPWYE